MAASTQARPRKGGYSQIADSTVPWGVKHSRLCTTDPARIRVRGWICRMREGGRLRLGLGV